MGTFLSLMLIALVVPLRMPTSELEAGDVVIHGKEMGVSLLLPLSCRSPIAARPYRATRLAV